MKKDKIKTEKYVSEDAKEVRNLIIITVIIVLLAVGLYFITDKTLKKDDNVSVDFDYNNATIGMIFNRPYDEYYVFAYDKNDNKASKYNSLLSAYEEKDDAKKIYFVDMSDEFNNDYLSDTSNKKATNSSEIKINKSALILIKDGKIVNYYESESEYEEVLK